jgi:RNA polymerase sigma-70 factor (ECF subfamily)
MSEHEHAESLADDVLLRNIGQDCSHCFELLFHRYCRQVHSISFRILRDRAEAEDILQEVFLSIYLQQERFDSRRGSVRTWILQFAYFKALLRRRYLGIRHFYKQEEVSEGKEIHRNQSSVSFGMNPNEWARYVETGIVTLSAKQRRTIEIVHFEGYTLQEASEILRETLASTRNNYYRGLKALRDFLGVRTALKKAKENVILERNDVPL